MRMQKVEKIECKNCRGAGWIPTNRKWKSKKEAHAIMLLQCGVSGASPWSPNVTLDMKIDALRICPECNGDGWTSLRYYKE